MGRLPRGGDLVEGLLDACRRRQVRTGAVVVIGALESAEVTHYDIHGRSYRPGRPLSGPLEILTAAGNLSEREGDLSLHLHVTLSREGDNGIEVLGGHLLAGVVFACEFTVTALDDVLLRRGEDPDTGLLLWKEGFERDAEEDAGTPLAEMARVESSPSGAEGTVLARRSAPEPRPSSSQRPRQQGGAGASAAENAPAAKRTPGKETASGAVSGPASTTSWAEVAAASRRAQASAPPEPESLPARPRPVEPEEDMEEEPEDELDYLDVSPGDIVEHPKFKRCKVARVEGDMEFVQVRLRNGNLVRLSLDIVRLVLVGSEDGHQVFKAIIDT